MDAVLEFILSFAGKYPVIASILMVVGGLRAVFKPLMAVAHAYVEYSASPKDNEALAKVEGSKIYKGLAFVLDYLASVKLPVK